VNLKHRLLDDCLWVRPTARELFLMARDWRTWAETERDPEKVAKLNRHGDRCEALARSAHSVDVDRGVPAMPSAARKAKERADNSTDAVAHLSGVTDAMHALLEQRADELMGCTENSPEERELDASVLPRYSAADCREDWSHLMRWLSALSNFELMLFIVSVGVLVAGGLLLLEIAGVSLFSWQ
jgi:hypothetical protein